MSEPPINQKLYPDVASAGGLVAAVQQSLDRHKSALTATGMPGSRFSTYARIEQRNRSSQIYLAANERLFLFDLWRDGVMYGNGRSTDIDEVVSAIRDWIGVACTVAEIGRRACIQLVSTAFVYDNGQEVEHRWESYLSDPDQDLRELMPFITLAARQPLLRALFPYTSHSTFCFSRCTGYPFSSDCPHVTPDGKGRFTVGKHGGPILGRGDAEFALSLVLEHLPANCGPAIRGTAAKLVGGR